MNNNKNILFEKFISQESPLSSIEFLDDTNENIIDQFKVIIDINKKRFHKVGYRFDEDASSIIHRKILT